MSKVKYWSTEYIEEALSDHATRTKQGKDLENNREEMQKVLSMRIEAENERELKKREREEAMCEEEEAKRLRELILLNPADVKLLKKEYLALTGKHFRRRRGE